jgi:prepilin-type N-terminal cleavage/methylation domain-containing protein
MRLHLTLPLSAGPTRGRRGFTLIELLIVVVIIAVLAMLAIPRFATTKGKANIATVKSDLRTLATAQEGYFYEHGVYTTDLAQLRLEPSQSVTVTVGEATAAGWSATAVHPGSPPIACAVFYGAATPVAPATVEGVASCE